MGKISLSLHFFDLALFYVFPFRAIPDYYQHIFSLVYAVKEIKKSYSILANVSLGLQIYDSYFDARFTYHNTLSLFSSSKNVVPNYDCDPHKRLIAVIGGLDYKTSFHINTLSDIYKIPQVCSFFYSEGDSR